MEGVTTAIVAFIFVCIVYPRLVKHRPQYYAAVGMAMGIILMDALGRMTDEKSSFRVFAYFVGAFLQIIAFVMLILCTGGLTAGELAGEMFKTVDLVRRGGEKETIVVPLRGEKPKPRAEREAPLRDLESERPRPVDPGSNIPLE